MMKTMNMTDYTVVVVGTDGSDLSDQTVARAAWIAKYEDADLVIVCAYSEMSRRDEAKNVATTGGDARTTEVIGRGTASDAMSRAVAVAAKEGATVAAALLLEGDAGAVLVKTARDRNAELLVIGAHQDRSIADRLLGTVSMEVVKRSPCDVLIVRPTAPEKQHKPKET